MTTAAESHLCTIVSYVAMVIEHTSHTKCHDWNLAVFGRRWWLLPGVAQPSEVRNNELQALQWKAEPSYDLHPGYSALSS